MEDIGAYELEETKEEIVDFMRYESVNGNIRQSGEEGNVWCDVNGKAL